MTTIQNGDTVRVVTDNWEAIGSVSGLEHNKEYSTDETFYFTLKVTEALAGDVDPESYKTGCRLTHIEDVVEVQ